MKQNIIGVGNTATVYQWEDGKVLKLFYENYPVEAVEREYKNAKAIENINFNKPKAYEMIQIEGRNGIVYDRVEGEALLDYVLRTGDILSCAEYMAKEHKAILQNTIEEVQDYKSILRYFIGNGSSVDLQIKEETLHILAGLDDGNTLCHGDMHPGNILLSNGKAMVIDFMNICRGHYLYDVARTVYLVEYTPVQADADNKELLLHFKKTLADLYLKQMNVTRDMIKDYLTVIAIARKGECPNE